MAWILSGRLVGGRFQRGRVCCRGWWVALGFLLTGWAVGAGSVGNRDVHAMRDSIGLDSRILGSSGLRRGVNIWQDGYSTSIGYTDLEGALLFPYTAGRMIGLAVSFWRTGLIHFSGWAHTWKDGASAAFDGSVWLLAWRVIFVFDLSFYIQVCALIIIQS